MIEIGAKTRRADQAGLCGRASEEGVPMVHYKKYVAGWLDSSIHEFLQVFPRRFESMKYALITCLDSNLSPKTLLKISPELRSVDLGARRLGSGLLLPTRRLLEANGRHRLFFGFDEVWFFPGDKIEPKPNAAWLVGPGRIDQNKLDRLGKWIAANSCSLALGDGDGLNFIVKARGLVEHLLGHSMEQSSMNAAVALSSEDSPD